MEPDWKIPHQWLETTSIAALQAGMAAGEYAAADLVRWYRERVEATNQSGPGLRAVIELNPDADRDAERLDRERATSGARGPLHGIPVLIKDNIDTAGRMETTAGSLALVGFPAQRDAHVVAQLRRAGAIIFGKANLSEWANFRGARSSSGWSARGGQTRNPYSLDRSPGGSSSGSGAAVAAAMAPAALGTETDGSIISPSAANGIVGIKPTVGLTSRTGVIPIAHSQDTVGPMCLTVRDAALVLGAIAGADPEDPATMATHQRAARSHTDYTRFLNEDGLRGARIGVPRSCLFGYSAAADRVAEEALLVLKSCGAVVVDPADIPSMKEIQASSYELDVLLFEFKADMESYLGTRRPDCGFRTLEDLIRFNQEHAEDELAHFGQEYFEAAWAKGPLSDPAYVKAIRESRRLSRDEGIDKVMDAMDLDALIMPSQAPAWKIDWINGDHIKGGSTQAAAMAGYPAITLPAGYAKGLPVGVTFVGRAYGEPTLIRIAYAFEQATQVRRPPAYRSHSEP